MKLYTQFALLFIFLSLNGYSQVAKNLKLVWSDEFNGTTLDASKWQPCPEWARQGGSYWSNDNYELNGSGKLKLKVTERNDSVFCGAIRTRNLFSKKYGYFEVKCKVPQMQGGWAAFWMMPMRNLPGNSGNDGTEIDIFESINGWNGKINHALHWDGYGADHQKQPFSMNRPDLYDDQYHVFGVKWTPQEYIFYIDNQETWRTSAGGVSDVEQYLKLTMEVSDGSWAGSWSNQKAKPIYWLVDYVRVYNHEPETETQTPTLDFTVLESGQKFNIGDEINMKVNVTGDLSQLSELRFIYQKTGEDNQIITTADIVENKTDYWNQWIPTEAGNYTLKVSGFKNGEYVTNVVANIEVEPDSTPLELNFTVLESGQKFNIGDEINMKVIITGNLSQLSELKFIYQKTGEDNQIITTSNIIENRADYWNQWIPTEAGNYALKVEGFKEGTYIKNVVANIEVKPDPLNLKFRVLETDQIYNVGDEIKMHVELFGDTAQIDEIRFISQKDEGQNTVLKTVKLDGVKTIHYYKWTPTEAGNYALKVNSFKEGTYVKNVVAQITLEQVITNTTQVLQENTNIYPNPTTGKLFVPVNDDFEFVVFDTMGKILLQGKKSKAERAIDLSLLPEGSYLLKVISQENTQTFKVLKK